MKKYLLFAGHYHYPSGGAGDFRIDSDSIDELKEYFTEHTEEIKESYVDNWGQIVESDTMNIILFGHIQNTDREYKVLSTAIWAATTKEVWDLRT